MLATLNHQLLLGCPIPGLCHRLGVQEWPALFEVVGCRAVCLQHDLLHGPRCNVLLLSGDFSLGIRVCTPRENSTHTRPNGSQPVAAEDQRLSSSVNRDWLVNLNPDLPQRVTREANRPILLTPHLQKTGIAYQHTKRDSISGMHSFGMCCKGTAREACITAVQLHRMFRSRIPVYPDGKSWPHDAETGDVVNDDLGMHRHPLNKPRSYSGLSVPHRPGAE